MLKVDGKKQDKRLILKDNAWRPYKQSLVVYAKIMTEDFVVETEGAVLEGKKGDFLVWGANGNRWPIAAARFNAMFEKI